jgi:3-oxoacyl-[acyl-carrier protein] reductase
MFALTDRVAIVTGGSRGIGRACAETLASLGATVVLTYVKGEAAALEAVAAIEAKGGRAKAMKADVAVSPEMDAVVDATVKEFGRLDVLVANAGIAIDGLLLRLKDDDVDALVATNLRGAIASARAAVKPMMKARYGRVIFLSSVVGEMGNVGQTAYAATKAGVIGAAKSIAREYASRNVTVNVVAPGFIDTDMTAHMTDAMKTQLLAGIPLGRTGQASEIAAAVAFLASSEASYITGQVLRVNGGLYV